MFAGLPGDSHREPNFKVGDVVRVNQTCFWNALHGLVACVMSVTSSGQLEVAFFKPTGSARWVIKPQSADKLSALEALVQETT